jgi:hypothetical protein
MLYKGFEIVLTGLIIFSFGLLFGYYSHTPRTVEKIVTVEKVVEKRAEVKVANDIKEKKVTIVRKYDTKKKKPIVAQETYTISWAEDYSKTLVNQHSTEQFKTFEQTKQSVGRFGLAVLYPIDTARNVNDLNLQLSFRLFDSFYLLAQTTFGLTKYEVGVGVLF